MRQRQPKHVPRVLCLIHATTHVHDVIVWTGQLVWLCYIVVSIKLGNVMPVPKMVLMTTTGEWVVTYNVLIALMCALEM